MQDVYIYIGFFLGEVYVCFWLLKNNHQAAQCTNKMSIQFIDFELDSYFLFPLKIPIINKVWTTEIFAELGSATLKCSGATATPTRL